MQNQEKQKSPTIVELPEDPNVTSSSDPPYFDWCIENLITEDTYWGDIDWYAKFNRERNAFDYYFGTEEHATMFRLRWL